MNPECRRQYGIGIAVTICLVAGAFLLVRASNRSPAGASAEPATADDPGRRYA